MKNWCLDRFQCPRTLLQPPIFVDEASAPTEFINSPSTGLALNGMDVDHTSAVEDNSNLYLLNFCPAVIQGPS